MYTHQIDADIAVLMPKLSPNTGERFKERYSGLEKALAKRGLMSFFAEGHDSFTKETKYFRNVFDSDRNVLAQSGSADVVRDLTMSLDNKPLYESGLTVVHNPELNRFIADKQSVYELLPEIHPKTISVQAAQVLDAIDRLRDLGLREIIIKPATGLKSEGIVLVDGQKKLANLQLNNGRYLVQEYLDTSGGIPELGIRGTHNLRMISIGTKVIGAVARERGSNSKILRDDNYGKVYDPDELPDSIMGIADYVHEGLSKIEGAKDGVLAIDVMRGKGSDGEARDVVCEVNRRPMRISPFDLMDRGNSDPDGLLRLGRNWDGAEADLLAKLVR